MSPSPSPRPAPAPITAGLGLALLLGACAGEAPRVVTAPPPPPLVAPPPPAATDWRDLPIGPGTWRYGIDGEGSHASYGDFRLACVKATRQIRLSRTGAGTTLTVKTSYGSRTLAAIAGVATLPAGDPLFDQMAFSRARFSIEAPGAGLLMMPAWAEPARVVEDCRG